MPRRTDGRRMMQRNLKQKKRSEWDNAQERSRVLTPIHVCVNACEVQGTGCK